MEYMIEAKGLKKSYQDRDENRPVLNGVDFHVRKGEYVAVMGPSGSGKTTLLFCISGMDRAGEGSIVFEGKKLHECTEKELAGIRRNRMGFVFQQPGLLKNLNILDNIILTAVREDKKKKKEIVARAEKLMEETGIAELRNREIHKVSGGQLQRAGICRALMNKPEILFGDEPTGALNSKAAEEIRNIFTRINREGTAIVLVTHDARVAADAERVVFMKDGELVSEICLGKKQEEKTEKRMEQVREEMKKLEI